MNFLLLVFGFGLGWMIANGGIGTKEEAGEGEEGGEEGGVEAGTGEGEGSRWKVQEYEMNRFLFDYHLIFHFLSISNCETCDDSPASNKMKTEHQRRKRRVEYSPYAIAKQ